MLKVSLIWLFLLFSLFAQSFHSIQPLSSRRLVKIVKAGRSGAGKLQRVLRSTQARNQALSLEVGEHRRSLLHLAPSPVTIDFLLASARKQACEVSIGSKEQGLANSIIRYINIPDAHGLTPLHIATAECRSSVITRLLKEEVQSPQEKNKTIPAANINACDHFGRVPLHYARKKEAVKILLPEGALVDAQDKAGRTPLHVAAHNGDLSVVKELVEQGKASPEIKDQDGRTPLHLASFAGHSEVACYLVSGCGTCNARCDVADGKGLLPFHLAAMSNNVSLLSFLNKKVRDVNEVVDAQGQTPLHSAAAAGALNSVKFLVEQGASIVADRSGKTPLDSASAHGRKEIVSYLADLISKNKIRKPRVYEERSRSFSLFE